jgi:hypothetical protein
MRDSKAKSNFLWSFFNGLLFWKRKPTAQELLLKSLFVSEEKWEREGLIQSRTSPSQDHGKKELTVNN